MLQTLLHYIVTLLRYTTNSIMVHYAATLLCDVANFIVLHYKFCCVVREFYCVTLQVLLHVELHRP
jgi:hypothetical protein